MQKCLLKLRTCPPIHLKSPAAHECHPVPRSSPAASFRSEASAFTALRTV
ncbi:uncharacterized protein LACBIDRAFT_317714 [Laccaria bicolor S238N-H82]|uniref:Predicted protein n=1 Tax=Laccaria bicolor (strain S238N-H82 / ATCC MYA-4686) TaxID=486041 RepID=B0E574_LACBS|nr:uncharacterized protein LACBIDRAFT_317714 [Laccaria bicolor S238N-H82]EDQ98005.1 predicted protein [Laccaria bicolor S238N-H82]|eukprot:XP_001891342.1 predicted protein [Laccaria bicolor S238N-H82]